MKDLRNGIGTVGRLAVGEGTRTSPSSASLFGSVETFLGSRFRDSSAGSHTGFLAPEVVLGSSAKAGSAAGFFLRSRLDRRCEQISFRFWAAVHRRQFQTASETGGCMPVTTQRTLDFKEVRSFGRIQGEFELSDLTQIQTESYARFLQVDKRPDGRTNQGLEEILREVFPIESYRRAVRLEYVRYELGKPRYTATECRQLRLTYGRPFRVWLRLVKEQPIEEEVYLGDMRSCSAAASSSSTRRTRRRQPVAPLAPASTSCSLSSRETARATRAASFRSAEAGLNFAVSKKDALGVRIDQSGKFLRHDPVAGHGAGILD